MESHGDLEEEGGSWQEERLHRKGEIGKGFRGEIGRRMGVEGER